MNQEVAALGRSNASVMSTSDEKKTGSNVESDTSPDIIIDNNQGPTAVSGQNCESSAVDGTSNGDNSPGLTGAKGESNVDNGKSEHANEIISDHANRGDSSASPGGQTVLQPSPTSSSQNTHPKAQIEVENSAQHVSDGDTSGNQNKPLSINGEAEAAASCADKVVTLQTMPPSASVTSSTSVATEDGSSPDTSTGLSSDASPSLNNAMDNATASSGDGSVAMETEQSLSGSIATDEKPSTSSAGAEAGASASATDSSQPLQSVYHVKWIQFKDSNTAIITQNENGPCPLLAIMNVLLLQGKVKLPAMIEMVTSGQLMEYLGDCIFEHAPKDISEDAQLNYEQNMHDAMAVFHKLQTGLDVNVKFTGVGDFEYTPECIVFDLLSIPLYHGWLVDPESPEVVAAIGNFSYNQLVEKIIVQKGSKREELMTEALIAEEFLDRTAHQLTYHGLSELVTSVKEDELCVFFRNNHFSTLYKHKNELFVLVTDQGFLTESSVVWETLSNVEGDGHFVDANFRTYTKPEPSTSPIPVPSIPVGTDQQIDTDYMVALSLQQEQQETTEMPMAWQPAAPQSLSDHEFAMRLQEEENRRAATLAQRQQQQQPPKRQASTTSSGSQKKKNSECVIL